MSATQRAGYSVYRTPGARSRWHWTCTTHPAGKHGGRTRTLRAAIAACRRHARSKDIDCALIEMPA